MIIVCLTLVLAWALPAFIPHWLGLGNRPGYRPRDFERHAWMAGQKLGREKEHLTNPQVRQNYERKIKKVTPPDVTDFLKTQEFAFEAGYREASGSKKRARQK